MSKQVPPAGSLAICMGRYSSDMQNPLSADDQVRMGVDICNRLCWKVVRTETDEAKSGRTMVGRTGLYNVLAAAEAGECDVVVVEDISRIARNARDMMDIAERLREANVVIYTFAGGVVNGMELAIRAQMAQEASEEHAARVKRGLKSAAARGKVLGLAYGYVRLEKPDDHGLLRAVDETLRPVILRIYEDLAAGLSTHAICLALTREGVPPPKGKFWRPKVLTGNKHLQTGIGRNPLYMGKWIYNRSSSRLIPSTGMIKVTTTPVSEHVVSDVPQLAIVPTELWNAVQDVLDDRSYTIPNKARQPPYLFSGLIKCGCCGENYTAIAAKLGCSGRRYGNGCSNRRRVDRNDLETAIFRGLLNRLLLEHNVDTYLEEYRRESAAAAAEYGGRADATRGQLLELDRQIENVMTHVRGGAEGYAAKLLNKELDELGARRKQLERSVRQTAPPPDLPMDLPAIVARLTALVTDLGTALRGPERDAARSREVIRSFIDQIRVTPVASNGRVDGRGSGPIRVTVEGSLTSMLDEAFTDRVIQRRGANPATLDLPNVTFSYYIDLISLDSSSRLGSSADIARLCHLLDDAFAPLTNAEIMEAFRRGAPSLATDAPRALELRARSAVTYLKEADLIRPVRFVGGLGSGWVWKARPFTDADWRERAAVRDRPAAPIGIIRITAPEPFAVIVGQSPVPASDTLDEAERRDAERHD